MKKKILFIGPYGPIGGVSVHIKRLASLLNNKYDVSFIDESPKNHTIKEVFNIRSLNAFRYFSLVAKSDIVHIHSGITILRFIHVLSAFLFGKKVIVSFHSLNNLSSNKIIFINKLIIPLCSRVICVSEEINNTLKPNKGIIFPAFVPPNISTEPNLPETIQALLDYNFEKKIIVSNAFRLDINDGEDLYGLDLLIEVARRIIEENLAYKIIFVIADSKGGNGLFLKYSKLIKKEALEEVITLIPYPISFINLVLQSNLVIRATNTDGDALTVREAIYLNRIIIASDVTKRPEGTVLFRNRDSEDLFQKIKQVLQLEENKDKPKTDVTNRAKEFYINSYEEIYK